MAEILILLTLIYIIYRECGDKDKQKLKRDFKKKKYSIHYPSTLYHSDHHGRCDSATLIFSQDAKTSHIRQALFEIKQEEPQVSTITFRNLPLYMFQPGTFTDFNFFRLDFSNVDYVGGDFGHRCYDFFSDEFPCSRLILPKNITSIHWEEHCRNVHTIVIPSPTLVPVHWWSEPKSNPIQVSDDFTIEVPKNILTDYLNDPKWTSIELVNASGHPVGVKFAPIDITFSTDDYENFR